MAFDGQPPWMRGDIVVAACLSLPVGNVLGQTPAGNPAIYAVTPVPSGAVVPARLLTPGEAEAVKRGDLRIIPVALDPQGLRGRPFATALTLMREDQLPGENTD